MLTVLSSDMLTVKESPVIIAPGSCYSEGTGFEGHAYFEAASIRKKDGKYWFIYSSEVMHELCYAVADDPRGEFRYGGVLVSNCDLHIDTYKPALEATAYGANNHGSMVQIEDQWYIFYHRHTNGNWFSRQGCLEPLCFREDGSAIQAEITSCGPNGGPLPDIGEYPAYIACNIFNDNHSIYIEDTAARVVQNGGEEQYPYAYIRKITDGTTVGFKYFDCRGVKGLRIMTRAYAHGDIEIRASYNGDVLGRIKVDGSNIWLAGECFFEKQAFPDGVQPLYLTFRGRGTCSLKAFEFLH